MTNATPGSDKVFAGSVPKLYEKHLVPLLFLPYAADAVKRLAARGPARVLEIACGTGVVTRAMAKGLPPGTSIVATDLNPGMLEEAAARGTERPVEWRPADALELPFEDASFDAVVVNFGVMFYPDRVQGHREARRVLRPGGLYLFYVWEGLAANEFADVITRALAERYPADPPRFLARTPYGHSDRDAHRAELAAAGFAGAVAFDDLPARSRADSALEVALGYCQGTPLKGEIEALDPEGLGAATEAAAAAVAAKFGNGAVDAGIGAIAVSVEK